MAEEQSEVVTTAAVPAPERTPAFALSAEEVAASLGTIPEVGLSTAEAAARRARFGHNLLRRQKPRSAFAILSHQFKSLIVWLLLAAAAFSLAVGDQIEAAAITVVLILNGAIGFFTELRAARSMEALLHFAEVRTRVRRDGKATMIDARDLVPGDIVIFEAGDVVTADLRLVTASKLECDESVLTGESLPVTKSPDPVAPDAVLGDRKSMVFKGSAITQGAGEAVVVATGMDTEIGRISKLTQEANSKASPLEERLENLGQKLIWLTLALALLTITAGILRGHELTEMIQIGVALAVAAIPEGLPVVATLCLARGMLRMAQHNALVNRLSSVETLGATTMILTDKTGTLTENQMTVERFLLDEGDREPLPGIDALTPLGWSLKVGALCTNTVPADRWRSAGGDPMEIALVKAAEEAGLSGLWEEFGEEVNHHAFDPEVLMMAKVYGDGEEFLYAVKGAPEAVIDICDQVLGLDGLRRLTQEDGAVWHRRTSEAAAAGLRSIALAMKHTKCPDDAPYEGLTLLGVVCLADPMRSDVPATIAACRNAGLRVVMVTGDHAATAARVARDAGICEDGPYVIEGSDLIGFDPETAPASTLDRIRHADVLSRVAPETKLALVKFFQQSGEIVSMTGDGVNDAPALRQADIGVAMGLRGTQVAREAADMVLKDDSLATIVVAVKQGRVIFGNIRAFVIYLMSCNLCEVLVVGIAVSAGLPAPLLPLQILFLNLVTDVFPAFALGLGQGDDAVMHRPPRDPEEPIVGKRQWIEIALLGLLLTGSTLAAFSLALFWLGLGYGPAVTVSFVTLALAQIWNIFNVRVSGAGLFVNDVTLNPYVWAAVALSLLLTGIALWSPGLSAVLNLPSPGTEGILLALAMSIVPFLVRSIIHLAQTPLDRAYA